MEHIVRSAFAGFFLMVASSASAGSVVRQTHLRLGAVNATAELDPEWKASVATTLASLDFNAPKAPKAPKADGKKGKQKGVGVQVEEKEMEKFLGLLSEKCSTRFSAMMQGDGPQLHLFGRAKYARTEDYCTKELNGKICATKAHIMKERTVNGRTMESSMDAQGDSCLPSECMAQKDLNNLAAFMQERAQTAIGAVGNTVLLQVDCSASGGNKVVVGSGGYVSSGAVSEHAADSEKSTETQHEVATKDPVATKDEVAAKDDVATKEPVAKHSSATRSALAGSMFMLLVVRSLF